MKLQNHEKNIAVLLLLVIYIAFIGLGIPDSLFGTAWPAIYTELDLKVSWANFVTVLISGGTILSSLLANRLIGRFGTGMVTAVSTVLTAGALLGFSFSKSMLCFCLCAIPLGLGAGAIDTALNHYVALHYRAAHMNFLHCFYGIGVSLSPFLMSRALMNSSWRDGYHMIFWFQTAIAGLTVLSLPLWRRAHTTEASTEEDKQQSIPLRSLIRNSQLQLVCTAYIGSCGLEYICGIWGSTFFVQAKGITAAMAAQAVMFYYVGMAVGRFLSGVLVSKMTSQRLIWIGQCITWIAVLGMLLPLPDVLTAGLLFLIGLGNGPIFPNLLHLTPQLFGRASSQSVIGVQMAASYLSILLMPALFGLVAEYISVTLFPYVLLVMLMIMVPGNLCIYKRLRSSNP